jgi:hypothetical protein
MSLVDEVGFPIDDDRGYEDEEEELPEWADEDDGYDEDDEWGWV